MHCPYCGTNKDKVIDSRATDAGKAIRRRRQCLQCGKRFTTYEHIEETNKLWVIKKDGTRVPYERQKMLRGVEMACYKRPITEEQIAKLVDSVEEELQSRVERDVPAEEIGQLLSDKLKQLDQVAYVRFASVYKQFRDLDDLIQEVRDVLSSADPTQGAGQGKLFK